MLDESRCHAVPVVKGNPWQHIPTAPGSQAGGSAQTGRKRKASPAGAMADGGGSADGADGWRGRLAMPDARNHRFFVSDVAELREQVCNMPPIEG